MALDLVVVVPLAFGWLVARPRGWPAVTMVPVALLGLALTARLLPAEQHGVLRAFEALALVLELGVLGWILWRARRAVRVARADALAEADPLLCLQHAAREVVGFERGAAILATELALLHYGLGAWRARPHVPLGAGAFTHHRRSAHGALVLAGLLLLAVEGLALHVLVARWSALAAWILTVAGLYTALWLVADLRATRLRPILVDEHGLRLRAGLRWSADVPRTELVGLVRKRPALPALRLSFLAAPARWLVLARPVRARGLYGLGREVQAFGLTLDDLPAFERALGLPEER